MASSMAKTRMPRIFSTFVLASILSLFISHVNSLASTDTITWGGDNSRTGYQSQVFSPFNHNMDPAAVGSSSFGQLFVTKLGGVYNGAAEQMYSQPLVYTPSTDPTQYVFVATTQNNIYKIDAKTGAIIAKRNLHIPFLAADLNGCVDISPYVGVTATGVIDPDTDTWYLTSKTYLDQTGGTGAQGKPNGRYYVHAINVDDLSERANFPVDIEGTVARNNPIRSFNGGIHHQRPALLHTGQFIYAGFASHCVQYNFTGWIMGWDKTTGATVERYATEGAGVPNTTPGAGVWMSGGGLASDDAGSLFFASGNGYASQLSTIPVNGRNPPTSLEEAAVHMTINDDGSLDVVDFFMPFEKTQLDGADRDLGTSPLELLPSQFACGDITRMGVVTGKSGKTYWLNLDDLGGYQNGPSKGDRHPSHVFKFSCDAGVASFTKVADSPTNNAYILGVGHGTVTSLNGQPGTGLVWTSDVQGSNLRIYKAIPENGLMTLINAFNVPNPLKFTRPVFGDGRVYLGNMAGALYAFGSPVNLPMNCSTPSNFGASNLKNATAAQTITCLANIAVTITNISLSGDPNFVITGLPTVPSQVAAGNTFSFQGYFNPQAVGPLSSDVLVATTNNVAGYSTTTPISLHGTGQSVSPLLAVSPVTLAFPSVVTGADIGGVNQSVIFTNLGNAHLTITNILYSVQSETGPYTPANITSSGPRVGPFTFIGVPSAISGNSENTVIVNFDTSASGNFAAYVVVESDGGNKTFDVVGTAGSAPSALLEFQTTDGLDWVQYTPGTNFTFGNVTEKLTRSLKMRLTNNATAGSAGLSVTVSKPPFGVAGIIGAANNVDLAEGTSLAAGQNATATLYCSVPKEQWNKDPYSGLAQWTMNTDDPNFGKHTNAMCIAACAAAGYTFCGTQYNTECWGGPSVPTLAVDESNCNYPCGGDINQICGGNGVGSGAGKAYISLFADSRGFNGNGTVTNPTTTGGAAAPTATGGPQIKQTIGNWSFQGCITESTTGRALSSKTFANDSMTLESCASFCSGYQMFGLEYGRECYCGNSLGAGSVNATNQADCSFPCSGDSTEFCGAGSRLELYSKLSSNTSTSKTTSTTATTSSSALSTTTTPVGPTIVPSAGLYTYFGCLTEGTSTRALGAASFPNNNQTVALCASSCSAYNYFGVDCSTVCAGDSTAYCGAGNRLNVYIKNGTLSTTSSSSSSLTSSSSSSSSQSQTSPVQTSSSTVSAVSVSSTSSIVSTTPSSSQTQTSTPSSSNTSNLVSTTSSSLSQAQSSTSSSQVSASTSSPSPLSPTTSTTKSAISSSPSTSSSAPPTTSPSSTSSPASTKASTSSVSATPTGPVVSNGNANFTYYSCATEPSAGRLLSSQVLNNGTGMTIELCLSTCYNYQYAGV
ncbi:WSC domain-containing protein [Lachnellula suecica]|uniref:WSC domain-containing protein n=1 Tax=Lachnellula suecica TaxID=602035 RepID=A0A8T9C8Z2_9HELO|nr:WSC domain-containing protein [Lachnellula suecica]